MKTLPGTFPGWRGEVKIVTIKEIAKYMDVSVSTVSRALNNHKDINQDTRKKVLEAAENLNYRPNSIAKSLIHNKTYTIGLMVPDIADPFFSSIAVGVEESLTDKGYQIVYGNTNRTRQKEKNFLESVLDRKMDGVIITPDNLDHEIITLIQNLEIPAIFLRRRTPDALNLPFIDVDHYSGAYKAVHHLLSKGHERIGFIGMTKESFISNERLRGFKDCMHQHHIHTSGKEIEIAGRTIESGKHAMQRLFEKNPDITAVFASNDLIAIGALEWLAQYNLSVPGRVSVIGFDNLELSSLYWIQLTTMAQPRKKMGRMAASMLLDLINGSENRESILLEANLIKRRTS
ncbi:LacI family DNA-binding transcriptional regulator [Lentibacillus salinarum]|uniref:LacI family DNA-binding transcriptional regulator n=1 Tax=Lentibacillus salinarum TaxID=446820 RepID=A0ABW3ZW01_9BACI